MGKLPKEKAYSNREIREKWHELANALSRIETQTTTTNGSVAAIKIQQTLWRGIGMATMFFLGAIVIPSLAFLYVQIFELPNTIDAKVSQGIQTAFANYSITPVK